MFFYLFLLQYIWNAVDWGTRPLPFPTDYLSYRVQTRVRSDFCHIYIKCWIYILLLFEQIHVVLFILVTGNPNYSRLRQTSPPHSPFSGRNSAYKRESGGNLRYINKIVNSCIFIIRTNICSQIYFSYSSLKMQSIKAHIPSPFPSDHLSYRVQTRVRSRFCRI